MGDSLSDIESVIPTKSQDARTKLADRLQSVNKTGFVNTLESLKKAAVDYQNSANAIFSLIGAQRTLPADQAKTALELVRRLKADAGDIEELSNDLARHARTFQK